MVEAEANPRVGWLLMAAGEDRGHAGNAGYDDQFDSYYSWDSNVPNHKQLRVGDPIALWDKKALLGISVIEHIDVTLGPKLLSRCPQCKTTRIGERKRIAPRFRCMRCRFEFDVPSNEVIEVELYRARFDAAWTPLGGLLDEKELRSLAIHDGDINAMRPMNWEALQESLHAKGVSPAVNRVKLRLDVNWNAERLGLIMPSGHEKAFVRVRRGQTQFRQHLLESQGSVCAFTGTAPSRVLEAGHLYSYAKLGTHFEHGGLMLRRDIHRLFDDGDLAVDPNALRIDVSTSLARFPQYAALHGNALSSAIRDEQTKWLRLHWNEHRT